jgi:hypothetical protein
MTDGGLRPVQNLRVNDTLLGYDPYAGKYTFATILDLKTVVTNNMLIIYTASGIPLRTDASPTEVLWTRLKNQTSLWLPVTQLSVGDSLYTQNGWITVLSIRLILGGPYTMYDLRTTAPYFANGYLDPTNPS